MKLKYICQKCGKIHSYEEYIESKFCSDCGTFLFEKQMQARTRGRKYWIFQANPKTFRIFDWWDDHPNDQIINWSVRQYGDEIKKGDFVILWLSGTQSGIYAIAEVITNPYSKSYSNEEKKYWVKQTELYKTKLRVDIKYIKKFLDKPISRNFCVDDQILSNLTILKQAQGTNFKVTEIQWNRLMEVISEKKL